ncbi:DUF5703 domain-containing protein [Bacteroides sp. 51]|uniref:DUF5703 domain-containing protein n=1 Tax=Bacteroides sp. 51 TaxID=2302938 RepID=UPI0013D4F735|nr:hypothetical protein [Bacteroides sp. 51]
MKRFFLVFIVLVGVSALRSQHAPSVIWNTLSKNSSESMPCGGGDIGMNVWVENGDLLFYISRSGTFDEHNCMLKQGRIRLRLSPNPFTDNNDFRQELKLNDGYVEIAAGGITIQLWADVFQPVVHLELNSRTPVTADVYYENWRYQDRIIRKGEGQQNSYKWAPPKDSYTAKDHVKVEGNSVVFYHRNPEETVFDVVVAQQGMEAVKSQMMNPLSNLTFGGKLWGEYLKYIGTSDDAYAGTDYRAWQFRTLKPVRKEHIRIALHSEQTPDIDTWHAGLNATIARISAKDKKQSRMWWNDFWQRSYIQASGKAEEITRNYTLFRYMLGCNAYGSAPTKFNGGLFTFDPCFVDEKQAFTPDYRKWGGGTMTAQNQRLVYWSMLKSGDSDMMPAQFDFYNRMLRNAELRSETYWGHKGACFAEQIENFGLPNPAEYGFKRPEWFDKGLEYNAWLEYEWDTVLEFCQMILETRNYNHADITSYLPLIESCLTFFDEHYRYRASRRGRKDLDGDGHLVLFPGSACETYKMTNNASSTIAALRTVLETYGQKPEMLKTIPPMPFRMIDGKEMISPAKTWERINNVETPQLYPVYPWRIYGVGKDSLDIARNTYLYDPDALKFRSHTGWKQDNIWAACMGLTNEAVRLAKLKLADGPHRFPAFWGPGYDWTPDHNHGGSGMIGLQEMLLQTNGDKIYLFPAWPLEWDVRFKLHALGQTIIEAELKGGEVTVLKVTPESRRQDIEIINKTP